MIPLWVAVLAMGFIDAPLMEQPSNLDKFNRTGQGRLATLRLGLQRVTRLGIAKFGRRSYRLRWEAVVQRTESGAERMVFEARRAFADTQETFEGIGTDAGELHSFVETFVGPMVVGTDGQIRQMGTKTAPDTTGAVLNSNVAATGLEPVTRGL